jgi:hypothetical protein
VQSVVGSRFHCTQFKSCLFFLASSVLSEQGIYVSRLNGNDRKTCGKLNSPCRTISYGKQKVSPGSYIYLDGSATSKNPYTCEDLDPGYPGIRLSKSVSFVSIRSRAHISYLHANSWLVDGTKFNKSQTFRWMDSTQSLVEVA